LQKKDPTLKKAEVKKELTIPKYGEVISKGAGFFV
jgi:hypothetical protein